MLDFVGLNSKDEIKKYDVVVCGAGPAGFSAAVCAARGGAKTLLTERSGCLGGIWTSGLLCWILDIKNKSDGGILKEMFDYLSGIGAGRFIADGKKFSCDVEEMKHYLEEKCISENVDFRLNTMLCGAKTEKRKIEYAVCASKSGMEYFSADVYIDATGDGDLGKAAGCGFSVGNEEGKTQPMSLIALLGGIDIQEAKYVNNSNTIPGNNPKKNLLEELKKAGIVPSYKEPTLMQLSDDGIFALMSNHEYGVDFSNEGEITNATVRARDEIYKTVKALKKLGGMWKSIHLIATAQNIGVREGRRIDGIYSITEEDVFGGSKFYDSVCDVGNLVDVHSPTAKDGGGVVMRERVSKPFQIPLRSLIAKDNDSLVMAGRCISGDFYSHSAYRLTGNAVSTGSAAGILAACAVKDKKSPKDISFERFSEMKNTLRF